MLHQKYRADKCGQAQQYSNRAVTHYPPEQARITIVKRVKTALNRCKKTHGTSCYDGYSDAATGYTASV